MGAQEFDHSIGAFVDQSNGCSWQGFGGEEADEETLSLCDLVISSDANEYWNDEFSKDDPQTASNSSSSDHNDFFEFLSQDFSASSADSSVYSGNNNNVIFCGKLIPCKGQQQPNIEEKVPQSLDSSKVMKQEINGEKINDNSSRFPWKKMSHSFNKSRTFPSSSSTKASKRQSLNKSLSMPVVGENKNLGDDKFDFSVKKVSILATPVKSRWYLFAFGVGRFPMEIELKDMKMRQNRKCKAMKLQQEEGSELGNVKGNKKQKKSGKGLWRLLKVLGWKNKQNYDAL